MYIDASDLTALLESDLFSGGWNGSLEPYPGQPTRQFAMAHLRKSLVKKYLPGTQTTSASADAAALDKFMKVNESCRNWCLDTSSLTTWEAEIVGEVKALIDDFFYPCGDRDFVLSQQSIYAGFGLGNGANIGCKETDLYSKLATSNLAATDRSLHILYMDAIQHHPTWLGMEISRDKRMGKSIVLGSRLSFVPKTTEISRTICTEPVLNMLFQKGIGNAIEQRLKQVFSIDLSKQPDRNAELALLGSLNGSFGTIDLSSASDSISINLCREVLPRRVFDILMRYRSPVAEIPSVGNVELHMISSMGNAFTFPLQTMLFAAIVCSCYRAYGLPVVFSRDSNWAKAQCGKNFAVFGDDIIVYKRAYKLVVRMLEVFGFVVNADKSFNEGGFRESCGHDYYFGREVRGVYIKSLRDSNDCYSAINRLVRWTARHGVYLTSLVSFLKKKCRFLPVPYEESDDAGIKVPLSMYTGRRKNRQGLVSYRLSALRERSVSLVWAETHYTNVRNSPCDVPVAPRLNGWFNNPDGLLFAFVAGSIREGKVVLRSQRRTAFIRRRCTPRWDYVPSAYGVNREWAADWKTAAEGLLG